MLLVECRECGGVEVCNTKHAKGVLRVVCRSCQRTNDQAHLRSVIRQQVAQERETIAYSPNYAA